MDIEHEHMRHSEHALLRGGLLARNVIFSFAGQAVPLLVAVFAVPEIISQFGVDRLGILMIAWAFVGYLSLFDLGISRALTQLLSSKIAAGEEERSSPIVWTSVLMMLVVGVIGSIVFWFASMPLVYHVLRTPDALKGETLRSFYLLALSIPIDVFTSCFRGILEAKQRFDIINYIRIPLGILTFASPFLVLPFSRSVFAIIVVMVLANILALIAYVIMAFRVMPSLSHDISFHARHVARLLGFGAWMTVSNVIGPIMIYMDRFFVGAVISIAAVAYYATPYEVITKLWIIPQAIVTVLFPAFALGFTRKTPRTLLIFERGLKYSFLVLFPIILMVITLSRFGLAIWLGPEFALKSARVLEWLSVGIFINSLSQVAFALIQGAGRPDLTAKVHMIELPFYLILLWSLTSSMGINGTALAWTLRVVIDAVIMFAIAGNIIGMKLSGAVKELVLMGSALFLLFLALFTYGYAVKLAFLLVVLTGFSIIAWRVVLTGEEKSWLRDRLSELSLRKA